VIFFLLVFKEVEYSINRGLA
jgi:hypothetical protein